MGVKSIYDILKDLWHLIKNRNHVQRYEFSEHLGAIAVLLDNACEKFAVNEKPTAESSELAVLINNAGNLAKVFEDKYPELKEIFETDLVKLGAQMRHADLFIDGEQLQYVLHPDMEHAEYIGYTPQNVEAVRLEMQRVAAKLRGYIPTVNPGTRPVDGSS